MMDQAPGATTDRPARAPLVLGALVAAAVVCNLNIASANVALPDIADALDASQTQLNLVGLGAGLGLSMSVVYFGAVSDRYGRKQLLMLGLAATIVTSFIAAFAPSIEILIAARVATGIAAGMAFPTTLSLITALWAQGPGRTGAIAIWSSVGGMASVGGAIVAGLVLAVFWWGSALLIAVPVAIVSLSLVARFVPSHVSESTEPVDHAGGVLSTLGIAALVLGISTALAPGQAAIGVGLLVLAVVLIGVFAWRQLRAANPLYDLKVARRRMFWAPALAGGIAFGGLIAAMFVGMQFLQNILGYSALAAGASVLPAAIGLVLMAPISARLVTRSGTRTTMLVGYSLVFVGFLAMLAWGEDISYLLVGFAFLAVGSGASFVMTAASRSLTNSTPVRRVGMASATSDLQGDLGGSVMQALLGALLAAGFSQSFADLIAASPEASSVSDDVSSALRSSFASAHHVAEQYPQYHDDILEAARQSLVAGAHGSYLVGAIAIVIGAAIVRFAIPSHKPELGLLDQYQQSSSPS